MDDEKKIVKVTIEYDDNSRTVYQEDENQMFLVIIDDAFHITTTSGVGEEDILNFSENAIHDKQTREIMEKVKPSTTTRHKGHLRVVK